MTLEPGAPYPLGATIVPGGVNFALFSANATAVLLCLFDAGDPMRETARLALPGRVDGVWHGFLAHERPETVLYGYRVEGPYAPEQGHRFNAHKLLIDPYARGFAGAIRLDSALFGYVEGQGTESFDTRDSAPFMPRCRVVAPRERRASTRPRHPWSRLVIAETHLKGFTRLNEAVPEALRGRYGGLCDPAAVAHFGALGVTAVELLPVHEFYDEVALTRRGLVNYWGYNSIGFFAPAARYAAGTRPEAEFAGMVDALHAAGLEVLLDVVYNHTAENDEFGPTLCFRGIDNASYYRLRDDDRRLYANDTGCGNMLDLRHPRVLQMVMDSLRFWAGEMDVDGFRFDLAPILARGEAGYTRQAPFLACAQQEPILAERRLIAEPWDLGAWATGRFPAGWAEWNDAYRDTVRRFWKGELGPAALAGALAGSAETFAHDGRAAWASVNFVTVHDGFTLADLVSYAHKHNEANGEGNRDGSDNSHSWNCGVEGPTDDPAIRAMRARLQRSFLLTLLVSRGVPMLLAGDEIGRSQHGNNNAYCQDSPIGWTDWATADTALAAFTTQAIALRSAHPALRAAAFLSDAEAAWLHPSGRVMGTGDWQDEGLRAFGLRVERERDRVLVLFNAGGSEVSFAIEPTGWELALGSEAADAPFTLSPGAVQVLTGGDWQGDAPAR